MKKGATLLEQLCLGRYHTLKRKKNPKFFVFFLRIWFFIVTLRVSQIITASFVHWRQKLYHANCVVCYKTLFLACCNAALHNKTAWIFYFFAALSMGAIDS